MARSKFDLSQKGAGFFAASLAAVLCFATAIVYYAAYEGDRYYAINVFYTLLGALPVAVIMVLIGAEGFVPAVLTTISGLAALQFIYAMYWDISVVLVGIDKTSFDTRFIACCALLVISFVLCEISLYTKMNKTPKTPKLVD